MATWQIESGYSQQDGIDEEIIIDTPQTNAMRNDPP
jgi:hypothetical protein